MRTFVATVSLASLLATSCTKPQAPVQPGTTFQAGGSLSEAERQSLVQVHQVFANWQPEFSAIWGRGEDCRHVCLRCPWGSIVYPYSVFVFDRHGHVTEANVINASSGAHPVTLVSISPLRVTFGGGTLPAGTWATNGFYYSHDAGCRRAADYGAELQQAQVTTSGGQTNGTK